MSILQRISLNKLYLCRVCYIRFHDSIRERFHAGPLIFTSRRDLERIENEKISIKKSDDIFKIRELTEKEKNYSSFKNAIDEYIQREGVYRRGHVEFIYKAYGKIKEYGIHKDLNAYKAVLSAFPEGVMRTTSMWEVESMHYPKQQQCAIDMMDEMERNGVCPDDEFGRMLDRIFGHKVHAFRKYKRMMYWMPKVKYINPYGLPQPIPTDRSALAVCALKRMCIDFETTISVHRSVEGHNLGDSFLVSAQSPKQQELVNRHSVEKPLYVEGPFSVWTAETQHNYFILSADARPLPSPPTREQLDDLQTDSWTKMFDDEDSTKDVIIAPSIHELPDRTILAMCITETSSKDSLMAWVRLLQLTNAKLADLLVLFQFKSSQNYVATTG